MDNKSKVEYSQEDLRKIKDYAFRKGIIHEKERSQESDSYSNLRLGINRAISDAECLKKLSDYVTKPKLYENFSIILGDLMKIKRKIDSAYKDGPGLHDQKSFTSTSSLDEVPQSQ